MRAKRKKKRTVVRVKGASGSSGAIWVMVRGLLRDSARRAHVVLGLELRRILFCAIFAAISPIPPLFLDSIAVT